MKRLLLFLPLLAFAQAANHSVALSWIASTDAISSSTYNVYRATGLCSGTPTFSKIATAIAGLTYTDGSVTVGNYCYTVTQTQNGAESAQATPLSVSVLPLAPSNLKGTPQ